MVAQWLHHSTNIENNIFKGCEFKLQPSFLFSFISYFLSRSELKTSFYNNYIITFYLPTWKKIIKIKNDRDILCFQLCFDEDYEGKQKK